MSLTTSRFKARYCVLAAAVICLAASVGQAQVVLKSNSPIAKKNAQKAELNGAAGGLAVTKVPTELVVGGVVIRQFYARRDDDKIRVVGIIGNSGKETTAPVYYKLFVQAGSGWAQIDNGSRLPLKPDEQGAIILDRALTNNAMRFKLEIAAARRNLAQECALEAKAPTFVVRYTTKNAWIRATTFFVAENPNQLNSQSARDYAKKLAAFGLDTKIRMYRDANPFGRDYDTVMCHSTDWITRTFATKAEADTQEQQLRGLVLLDAITIDRREH